MEGERENLRKVSQEAEPLLQTMQADKNFWIDKARVLRTSKVLQFDKKTGEVIPHQELNPVRKVWISLKTGLKGEAAYEAKARELAEAEGRLGEIIQQKAKKKEWGAVTPDQLGQMRKRLGGALL